MVFRSQVLLVKRLVLHAVLSLYLVALGFTVFTPKKAAFTGHESGLLFNISSFFHPFFQSKIAWTLGNVLLLAPLGILLHQITKKLSLLHISLICFTTSAAIELTQNLTLTRIPDLGTVMINGIGGSLCTLFFDRWQRTRSN